MKKLSLGLSLLLLLGSCSHSSQTEISDVAEETTPIDEEIINEKPKSLQVDADNFYFIANWLSNEEIIYVIQEDDLYLIKTFNIETSEQKTIYENSENIVNVLVHPSKDTLLVHSADNSTSAQIKIITIDGKVINDFSIASSEVEIVWNDLNPELILLTAFKEDWTYTNYIYNGANNHLDTIDLLDPFPKWLGVDKIVSIINRNPSSNSGELSIVTVENENSESMSQENVMYVDTFEGSLLIVQKVDGQEEVYSIYETSEKLLSTWNLPADFQEESSIQPTIQWLSHDSILMTSNSSNEEQTFNLVHIKDDEAQFLLENLEAPSLSCSPDGTKCLTGYTYDKMIELEHGEIIDWLIVN